MSDLIIPAIEPSSEVYLFISSSRAQALHALSRSSGDRSSASSTEGVSSKSFKWRALYIIDASAAILVSLVWTYRDHASVKRISDHSMGGLSGEKRKCLPNSRDLEVTPGVFRLPRNYLFPRERHA